jgi:hypothetical protein
MVHQSIAGAAVETAVVPPSAASTLRFEMPPMFRTASGRPAAEHRAVEGGHQRRALAAGRHVAAAEVRHHVDAAQLGEQGGVVQLQRVADAIELLPGGGARSGRGRRSRSDVGGRAGGGVAAVAAPRRHRCRTRPLAARAARCSSLSPGVLSASSSARRFVGGRARWHGPGRAGARRSKSASTPSTPSSEVPDIRPMKRSAMYAASRGEQGSALIRRWLAGPRSRQASCGAWPIASWSNAGRAAALDRRLPSCLRDVGRVLVHAVHAELEVQVRAGGPARGTDGADELAPWLTAWPAFTSMRLRCA